MNKNYQEYRNKLKEAFRRKRYRYFTREDRAYFRKKAIVDLGYYVGCGGSGLNIFKLDTSLDSNLDLYDDDIFGIDILSEISGNSCSSYHCAPDPLSVKYVKFLIWLSAQEEFQDKISPSILFTEEFYEIRTVCAILTLKEIDMLYLMPDIEKYITSKEYRHLLQKTKELIKQFNY